MINRIPLRGSRLVTRAVGSFARFNSSNSKDTVLKRYQDKLNERASALGLKDVKELQDKLKDEIEKKKKEFSSVDPLKELEEYERKQAEEIQKDRDNTIKVRSPIDKNAPKEPYKVLSSYLDVEKVKGLPPKELEYIWRARFQNNERSMVGIINNLQFATMYANAFKNPSFILPLPKSEEGYEMHFVQWSFVGPKTTHCMLTTVAEFKLHKEYAKPHTTLMFHQDLSGTNDVVLMNGQVEKESSLTMDEAQLLVLNVQRFYGGTENTKANEKRLELLRDFTRGKDDFNMDELIAEAASIE